VGPYIEVLRIFPGGCDVDGLSFPAIYSGMRAGQWHMTVYSVLTVCMYRTILNWECFSFNFISVLIQKAISGILNNGRTMPVPRLLFKTS
jgi:hypothetical protein